MKPTIIIVALVSFIALVLHRAPAQYGTITIFSQSVITNGHTVATNLVSTNLKVMRATFIGLKAGGVSNSAAVFIGADTNLQPYVIHPGERHVLETTPNTHINMKDLWLRVGTLNDGVTVLWQ